MKTPCFILLLIASIALAQPVRAETPMPCPPDKNPFGCFEIGLPGGKGEAAAGQSIDAFAQSDAPIKSFINLIVTFTTGIIVIISVITIVIAGYLYMTAAGNGTQLNSAKEMIQASLMGIFIAFISVVILNTINPFLGSDAVEPKLGEVKLADGGGGAGGSGGGGSGGNGGNNGGGGGLPDGNNGSGGNGGGGSTTPIGFVAPPTTYTDSNSVSVYMDRENYYIRRPDGDRTATLQEVVDLSRGTPVSGDRYTRVKIYRAGTSIPTRELGLQDALINAGIERTSIGWDQGGL